ncbi:hypothetical protein GCM10009119_08370 [Algoriphagus jejuensis]|uniref:DUF5615 domain-containing protein n=1 Tax=Algoriphagus jejuensis TaxID=419934 RepID=A0ABP3YCD3_9BACT
MKLLLDRNISRRIVKENNTFFPDSKQVREVGLEGFTDREFWTFANKNKFTIATFDSDFVGLSTLFHFLQR